MPRPRRQGEIALETWETLYKEKDDSPTVLVQQIIDHHELIAKEKIASLQTELNDALALVEQQSTKIKAMAKAAKLLVAGPPKAEELYQKGDMKGLTAVAENAVTCAGKQLDKKLLAEAWTWLGTAYSSKGNLKSGVEAFKRAQEVIKTLNQKDKDVASMKILVDKWQGDLKEPEAKFSAMLAKMQKR